jgi:hypothetical protein
MESNASKKTGFKGKRSKRKFGRNGKNGGADQKSSSNQPVIDAADDAAVLAPIPLRRERVAARKQTNSELAQKLRASTRECDREKREKEAVQMEHDHVAKNNNKLKKDVASLCTAVRESRAETRGLRKELSNAEKNNKVMENRLVSHEWEHSQALSERDKLYSAELLSQEKAHIDEMEQKEKEKMVSRRLLQLYHCKISFLCPLTNVSFSPCHT